MSVLRMGDIRFGLSQMNLADMDLYNRRLLNLYAKSWDTVELAYQHFRGLSGVEIAPVACDPKSGYKLVDGNQTVSSWLARDAGISIESAIEIINGFPMPVAPRLNQIAMNPRRFLGLAASITRSPKAIVFSTAGMDPLGSKNIHEYATDKFDGSLIHLDVMACKYCEYHDETFVMSQDLTVFGG
jgi:hypothetical protein